MEPLQSFAGHTDVIRSICHVEEKDQYLSGSWDKTIRVWFTQAKAASKLAHTFSLGSDGEPVSTSSPQASDDFDDDNFVSSYELEHPLVYPKALRSNTRPAFKILTKPGANGKGKSEQSAEGHEVRSLNAKNISNSFTVLQ